MPSGLYKKTEKHKRNISIALTGRKLSNIHRKRMGQTKIGNKYMLGKHHSEKTKRKLSTAHKGKKFSIEHRKKIGISQKGRTPGMLGKKHSTETRKKMSNARKNEKHPNWKGGITPENQKIRHSIEYELWRNSVFAHDGYTCQKYGTKGGKLHAHHIQNFAEFPELRFAIDNGVTLSDKAHKEFHKKYGKKNNTREQLEEFLN
mgnify:FL=1